MNEEVFHGTCPTSLCWLVEIKELTAPDKPNQPVRHKAVVSDAINSMHAMFATELNVSQMMQSGELRQCAIISTNDYLANRMNGKLCVPAALLPGKQTGCSIVLHTVH